MSAEAKAGPVKIEGEGSSEGVEGGVTVGPVKGSFGPKGVKAEIKVGELIKISGGLQPGKDGSVGWSANLEIGTIGKLIMPEEVAKVFKGTQETFSKSAGELVRNRDDPGQGQGARRRAGRGASSEAVEKAQKSAAQAKKPGWRIGVDIKGDGVRRRQRRRHADLDLVIPPEPFPKLSPALPVRWEPRADAAPMELLIVGGGLAAQRCIEVLRAAGDDRPVTVVGDEPVRPYDRPPLSKEGLLGPIDPSFRPEGWYAEHGVTLRLGSAAARARPGAPDRDARRRRAAALRHAADRDRRPRPRAARRAARPGAAELVRRRTVALRPAGRRPAGRRSAPG